MALPRRENRSYSRSPRSEDEYDVAGLDIIPRAALQGSVGRKLLGAIESLVNKGTIAAEGTTDPGKYKRWSEFGAQNMEPNMEGSPGINHYRYSKPKETKEITWPNRDVKRFSRAQAQEQGADPFMAHTHPGGDVASPQDTKVMRAFDRLNHAIVETPRPSKRPLPVLSKKTGLPLKGRFSFRDPMEHEFVGSEKQVQEFLNQRKLGQIPEDWQGAVEQYQFPGAFEKGGTNAPQVLKGVLEQMNTVPEWESSAMKALTELFPEMPKRELLYMLRQSGVGRMADSPKYKKEFDYTIHSPQGEDMRERVMKEFVDKAEPNL
tara:strand:- start:3605 stop:4564 length:960 start_codon:yes stop_codon:yes gene_type:complete